MFRCGTPIVVLEDGRNCEDALLDDHKAAAGDAIVDRVLAQPEVNQLPTCDAIELPAGQLGNVSVPHTRS
jgi:hypothetical protein